MLFYLFFILTGITAGTLSGLLGIGGGVVIVPALSYIFNHQSEIPSNMIMHVAAATSLSCMIFTTFAASITHYHLSDVCYRDFAVLLPSIGVGAVCGVLGASVLHADFLQVFFGVLLLVFSTQLLLSKPPTVLSPVLPNQASLGGVGLLIGSVSGLLGIGGGVLLVPYLRRFHLPLTTAVTLSAVSSFTIAVMGSITAMYLGLHDANLPKHTIGYVYWPAVLTIAIPSLIFAHIGAHMAHRAPVRLLTRIFAIFMLVTGIHMCWY